jgi:type II secretory pathway pseudopilin PulG
MTLIELLVVVSIMMLLAMIAMPAMRPAMENRQSREAARAVNVFFGAVRNRAIQTGRPCGALIQRFENQPQAGTVLQQVEMPPPYAGELTDSVVRAQTWTYRPTNPVTLHWPDGTVLVKLMLRADSGSRRQYDFFADIRRGDLVQLNGQGPWYTITEDPYDTAASPAGWGQDYDFPLKTPSDPSSPIDLNAGQDNDNDGWIESHFLTLKLNFSQGAMAPWPQRGANFNAGDFSPAVPFSVLRQPYVDPTGSVIVQRSAVAPLQLPRGVVIDLSESGTDSGPPLEPAGPNDRSPVVLLFSPNGEATQMYFYNLVTHQYAVTPLTEPVHFLVGKWNRLPATAPNLSANEVPGPPKEDDGLRNYQDLNNLWVSVNPQTGLVVCSKIAPTGTIDYSDRANRVQAFYAARRFAREMQMNMGGR